MDPGSFLVLLLRIVLPISILRYNVFGFLACVAADGLHAPIVHSVNLYLFLYAGPVVEYQVFDKWLDIYFLAFAVRASWKWQDDLNSRAMLWLWVVRLIGVIAFSLTGARYMLFFFPNLLVSFYFYVACMRRWLPRFVPQSARQLCVVLGVLLVPKLILEYWLHVEMLGLAEALTRHTPLRFPAATLWQSILPRF